MQTSTQEHKTIAYSFLSRVTSLLLSKHGLAPTVLHELSMLRSLLGPYEDIRIKGKLTAVKPDSTVSPFCQDVELQREAKNFLRQWIHSALVPESKHHQFSLDKTIENIETFAKRYQVTLNHLDVLKYYVSSRSTESIPNLIEAIVSYCQRHQVPLRHIRFHSDRNQPLLKEITLLHLAIIRGEPEIVQSFIQAPVGSWFYIPSTIWHYSSNNALHYCALYAPNDKELMGPAGDVAPTIKVAAHIQIANLLTDPNLPEHLEMNVHSSIDKAQWHLDGGTHLTSAAMSGSAALTKLFIEKSPSTDRPCWKLGRNDGKTPLDFAPEHIRKLPALMGPLRPPAPPAPPVASPKTASTTSHLLVAVLKPPAAAGPKILEPSKVGEEKDKKRKANVSVDETPSVKQEEPDVVVKQETTSPHRHN